MRVAGRVSWEPRQPNYVKEVRLTLLKVKRDGTGAIISSIEVGNAEARVDNRFAGGFSWHGQLDPDSGFKGDSQVVAKAFGQIEEVLETDTRDVVIGIA